MSAIIDLTGKIFGRLTVVRRIYSKNLPDWKKKQPQWLCLCECGKTVTKHGRYLRDGDTQSCGCIETEGLIKRNTVHGLTGTVEYSAWNSAKVRCYNPNNIKYPDYGGRGIKMCKRWLMGFEYFLSDMGKRPSRRYSLDRINVNGNYEPSNCRWATRKQQAQNKRNNHWIVYKNKRMIFSDWVKYFKSNTACVLEMIKRHPFEYVYKFYNQKKKRA